MNGDLETNNWLKLSTIISTQKREIKETRHNEKSYIK